MATMYVGGGLYLPTTGTASKTSTPTGGTVTVAQRNAIASAPKSTPVASSVTKKAPTTTAKPTTNTLSTMAGSSLGTTSTKPKTVSPTASLVTGSSSAAVPRNTAAQNAAVASLLSGGGTRSTGGINAALPQPPQLTKAQIGNRFTQSLASGASTGAAVPNPAGLTRDEADTLRSRFYTQFYSGQPVQRIADKPVPVSYDYMFGARNDDKPYVSPYDAERYGVMSQGPTLMPLPGRGEPGDYAGQFYRSMLATGAGAGNAIAAPVVGLTYGIGDALDGGDLVQDFLRGYGQGERGVNQFFAPTMELDPSKARKAGDVVNVASIAGMLPGVGPTRAAAAAAKAADAGIDAAVVAPRLPAAANVLDEGFVQRAAELNDQRLLANMMRENDTRGLTNAINENDALVLRNAMRENDTLNALNTAREARAAGPGFMSADEAADVIRPGPRVAADADRMDPFTKNMLLIAGGGAGVGIPGLAGLSLLANGQLGPAPTATTPQPVAEPGGIDVVPSASSGPRGVTPAQLAAIRQVTPAAYYPGPVSSSLTDDEAAALARQLEEDAALREELGITVDGGAPTAVADVPKVRPVGDSETDAMAEAALADFMAPENQAQLDAAVNSAEGREFGSGTPLEPGPGGDEAATATPAAGTKFTPGPGQFVGTNGYIYEQSSDGSFENVGRVPGYTPAQLSEAANKGAFRDPNNIVTGGAKPRKQVKKKKEGEETFFDKAGNILKERFDDSLFARLFLNQDDDAAAEEVAAGPEAVEYYSTPPASVPESLVSSSGSSKKRKPKDETDTGTGGTGGTGTSPYTPEMQAMLNALYGNYMRQYNGPGVGYVPGVDPERNYFTPAFADGGLVDGRLVLGDGGPKEDKIPAMIDGVEQAKLSNGEFVMTAAAVKNAGGGDIELGAKRLMDLNNMLSYGKPADQLKVQHVK